MIRVEPDEEGVRWAGETVRASEHCTIRLIVLKDVGSAAGSSADTGLLRGRGRWGMLGQRGPRASRGRIPATSQTEVSWAALDCRFAGHSSWRNARWVVPAATAPAVLRNPAVASAASHAGPG
ncbi:hypothetical protein [Streptomyces sp. NBC_01511]|uniref:hypothetical protein n=1 Tax=Streptomyces sp. NBC_01511 TaxID=2903889 RepID=UPI00386B4108